MRHIYQPEANMGEVIPFISRAERERIRLIREARTNYESVFPQSDPLTEPREESSIRAANVRRGDEALP